MIKDKIYFNSFCVKKITLKIPALLLVFLLLIFPFSLVFAESVTTYYPNKFYSASGNKKTKYIYAGDTLVAVINNVGGVVTPNYIHTDHLGGTNVVSNTGGGIVQTIDYYPYGAERICSGGSCDIKKKYIGQYSDTDTALDYLNARYYEGSRGQFISQDPEFWNPEKYLMDPQSLNSYSYARNNPINRSDPMGLFNIKTGEIEYGDTLSSITSLLNKTNITNYSISQISDLNEIEKPDEIFAGQIIKPNYSTPDITRSLNNLNQSHAAQMKNYNVPYSPINLLSSTVKEVETLDFANKFKPGGNWDLKLQKGIFCQSKDCGGQRAESYIYQAREVPNDAPGNIHYGYVGKNSGYSLNTLLFFGDVVQTIQHLGQFGDPASDKAYIIQGFNLNY